MHAAIKTRIDAIVDYHLAYYDKFPYSRPVLQRRDPHKRRYTRAPAKREWPQGRPMFDIDLDAVRVYTNHGTYACI